MKTTLLFAFILNCFVSSGQEFLDSTKMWNDMLFKQTTCNCSMKETHSYYLEGDSTINEKNYFVVMDSTYQALGGDVVPNISVSVAGFIREEILLEQIFFIAEGEVDETKIYDFKFGIDSILTLGSKTYYITAVDSVEFSGINRKVLTLTSDGNEIQWISGIGSDKGLFYFKEFNYLLLCVSDENVLLYENQEDYDCIYYDYLSVIDENEINLFQIHPNPAHSNMTLSSVSEIKKLEIIDLTGKVIRTEYPQTNEAFVDLNGFGSGLYLVRVDTHFEKLLVK